MTCFTQHSCAGLAAVTVSFVLLIAPARGQQDCVGDCSGNGQVTVAEVITGVGIALSTAPLDDCPAFDGNGDDGVGVDELISGVANSMGTCPVTRLVARRVAAAPAGINDAIWDDIAPLRPSLSNMTTGLLYGDGQLNMSGTFRGAADFNGGDAADLRLRAVHDGTDIFILAEWNDVTFNLDRRRWLFDGPADPRKPAESAEGWTSQLNDDKIGLAFEIEAASSGFGSFNDVGCAASCHNVAAVGGLDMRPEQGKVDFWHWKTSRSEPLGYVDDQVSSPDPGRVDDAGMSIEHRNRPSGGDNRSGPEFEWDGLVQEFERWDGRMITLDPAYVLLDAHRVAFEGDAEAGDATYMGSCAGCHGADGKGGTAEVDFTEPEFTRVSREDLDEAAADSGHPGAAAYNALTGEEKTDVLARLRGFSGVPGYYLTAPEGSVADVLTQSNVDYTRVDDVGRASYRLLMIRALDTGNDDDAEFAAGEEYAFGVALMDNDGRNHIGSRRETLSIAP